MPSWTLLSDNSFDWPSELRAASYKKAEKAGKIGPVIDALEKSEKHFKGIDFPYQWVTSNPTTHLNWQKHALSFMNGDAKKLASNLAEIRTRAKTKAGDKDVAACKDSKAALAAIIKAADTHVKLVQAAVIKKQVDELNELFGERRAEAVAKKLGSLIDEVKGVAGKKHPELPAAKKLLLGAGKAETPEEAKPDLEEAAELLTEASADMTGALSDLIKAKKEGMPANGLADGDYNTLARIASTLAPFAKSGNAWTKKFDLRTMLDAFKTISVQAASFDAVAKKMKG
ncbi:hypothetical protein [Sphingomonas jatrophae]|nr:hypothetical protein [Sphingomonas jatrophae]